MSRYQAKIIATEQEALQVISACSTGAKVKISNIKYLASNKVFLLSLERTKIESDQKDKKVNSICRFDYIEKVKSKNINQKDQEKVLELIGIDYLKYNEDDPPCVLKGTSVTLTFWICVGALLTIPVLSPTIYSAI